MNKYHILYNPLAASKSGEEKTYALADIFEGSNLVYYNLTEIDNLKEFILSLNREDTIILSGGDGTLNIFVNEMGDTEVENEILYFPTGTGNDFFHDINPNAEDKVCRINKYLHNLPIVRVKERTCKFINGIGFGIDGYCCEVGDRLKETSEKPVNYTAIAIKGLLFHYKPTNATVVVDGKEYNFKKVWMASTMKGRYYGGGMMNAPKQDRMNEDKTVSVVVFHGTGKIKTLAIFPSIFEGKHVEHSKNVSVLTGHEITVSFDAPRSLQIDGETILHVNEYSVSADI